MFVCLLATGGQAALADGVSAYLPLHIEPKIERDIERIMILADEPQLKRPYSVAMVQYAVTKACGKNPSLCRAVRAYLQRYSHDYGVTYASAAGAATSGAERVLPNEHGLPVQSAWEIAAQAYVQPSDYLLATAGAIAYDGRVVPTGSMLSVGFNWAQLDLGYRDHWFSPMTDSSMLIGTEAPTLPSITLSNYEPLTRFGFQYEVYLARMEHTDRITYQGNVSSGRPHLFGMQLSIEPFPGWSLGVSEQLQFGGGGLPGTARYLFDQIFKSRGETRTQSNQQAAYVSRFIFPGKTPFSVYFQYAGEDTSDGGSYLLGKSALSAGIDFPRLAHNLDLTYEVSEWQNAWYVHSVYQDGMTNHGLVLGHWGGDQRIFGDGVGARSQMLRLGWTPPFGGYLEGRLRNLVNQNYTGRNYRHEFDASLRYSRPWKGMTVGGDVFAGRDVFGKSFARIAGFVRYGGDEHDYDTATIDDDSDESTDSDNGTERFVDGGMSVSKIKTDFDPGLPLVTSKFGGGLHLGLGVRRAVTERNDLGVRIELDQVDGHSLIGVRAIDYRHRFHGSVALTAFAGVARYDLEIPAYSIYGGIGAQWRNIFPEWDLNADLRYAQNVARDRLLPTDPPGTRALIFYKIQGAALYLSRRF